MNINPPIFSALNMAWKQEYLIKHFENEFLYQNESPHILTLRQGFKQYESTDMVVVKLNNFQFLLQLNFSQT